MNYIEIVKVVAQLFPTLISLIKQVEEAFPQSGVGAQKLDMVTKMMEAAMEAAGHAKEAYDQIEPVIVKTVSAIVTIFNATGIFKK